MPKKSQGIRLIVEVANSDFDLDADILADGFVEDLKSDNVARWCDQVNKAISEARHLEFPGPQGSLGSSSEARARIHAQIVALQKQLAEIEQSEGP